MNCYGHLHITRLEVYMKKRMMGRVVDHSPTYVSFSLCQTNFGIDCDILS